LILLFHLVQTAPLGGLFFYQEFSMFVSIEPLLRTCTKLTLSLQTKGDDVVVFVRPEGSVNDAAMLQPLVLTASAAELDAGFADALAGYTGMRASLAEQVAATTAILEAAQKTHVAKATKVLSGNEATTTNAAAEVFSDDDEHDDSAEGEKAPLRPPLRQARHRRQKSPVPISLHFSTEVHMSIAVAALVREFVYNGVNLTDPGPAFTPEEVRDLYSAQYPELTTAAIDGPEYSGQVMRFKFVRAAGAKGAYA
jgi:PRTRC genetic system protein C